MLQKTLLAGLFASSILCATEEFNLISMKKYLTKENPYVYSALGKKYVTQEKLSYVQGVYDTKIVAKYDEKDYPYTDGTYYGTSLEKPTESGIDLSAGYRYAEGTQEYNNIKTGKNGEFLVGAKIPLISVLNRIDERRFRVGLTQMNLRKTDFEYKEAMRKFYFRVMSEYYTLLYNKSLLKISKEMLEKVQKRENFLEVNVEEGNLAEIVLLEAQQQVIHSKQDFIAKQRAYENVFVEFLKYLNLSKEKFEELYHLPLLPNIRQERFSLEESLHHAMKRRGDFQMLSTEIEKLLLEDKNNERKKYPEVNLGLYGVYDVNEQSGFKVSLNMSFPIARSQYYGKSAEIQESIKVIKNDKEIRLIELKADLQSIINSLNTVTKNIKNAQDESKLLQKLESAERRKYELGSSSLFLLNQREMLTMQAKKRILQYKLEYQLLFESYKRIISMHSLES
jgi:outer membrane protein TolC